MTQRSPIVWLDLFSQYALQVSGRCNLKCLHCSLWKDDFATAIKTDKDLAALVKKQQFYDYYPRSKRLCNIIGGDPFSQPYLPQILTFISQHQKIRFWTTGVAPLIEWPQIVDFIDDVMVYFPSSEDEHIREVSGGSGLDAIERCLSFLKEQGLPFQLNFHVRPETIEYLALVYEYAYYNGYRLLLHYDRHSLFTGDSTAFIRRFRKISGVDVFVNRGRFPGCPSVSHAAITRPMEHVKNALASAFNREARRFLG